MSSAKIASLTSSTSLRITGRIERPCRKSGRVDPEQVADRRIQVDLRDQRLRHAAAVEAARAAHDQQHADPAVGQRRLRARERQAVVGREDHQRVVGDVLLVERVEHGADALVERPRARLVGRHVLARLGRVRQVGGRQRVQAVADRRRREVLAVRLEEADRQEERLRRALAQQRRPRPARPPRRAWCRCRRRGRSRACRGRPTGAARRSARTSSRRRAACAAGAASSR